MDIAIQSLGKVSVIAVSGRIDDGAHLQLREGLRTMTDAGFSRFVLDLREAGLLDSLALGELVGCLKRARERGGDVRLVVAPEGIVHGMLQLTRLDHVFQIFGLLNDARMSFLSGPN